MVEVVRLAFVVHAIRNVRIAVLGAGQVILQPGVLHEHGLEVGVEGLGRGGAGAFRG